MNKRKRLLTLLINGVLLSSLCMVASAADTTTGSGSGVAYGTGSTAPIMLAGLAMLKLMVM